MSDDILKYIESYQDVRALTGLNKEELPDDVIGLSVYRIPLIMSLKSIKYDDTNLFDEFDSLESDSSLKLTTQLYSCNFVAWHILQAVGLRSYKVIADGKASLTRFSPESTYKSVMKNVQAGMNEAKASILGLVGIAQEDNPEQLVIASPSTDMVTG